MRPFFKSHLSDFLNYDILLGMNSKHIINKITRITSYFLLITVFATIPFSSNILCIETDGASSFENAPLGNCQASLYSNHDASASIENNSEEGTHDECIDCTDVSLSQTLSTKLQSDMDYTMVPDAFIVASTSYEVPVYTEPIKSVAPNLAFVPNQLHKHLQTIIFLI